MKKVLLLIFWIIGFVLGVYAQDCYPPTMQLGRKFFGEAKYKQATKQFKAALTCEDKPSNGDSIKVVERWIRASDSMEIVAVTMEKDKAISALLTVKANQSIEKGDVVMGFRYAQYAIEKDKDNIEAQTAFYSTVYQQKDKIFSPFYKSLKYIGYYSDMSFSPDGKKICMISTDHIIQIWDAENGKHIKDLTKISSGNIENITFSPDGKKICTVIHQQDNDSTYSNTDRDIVQIWDSETGKKLFEPNETGRQFFCVIFSPDSKFFCTVDWDVNLRIWDSETGKLISKMEVPDYSITEQPTWRYLIRFSPDAQKICFGVTHIDKISESEEDEIPDENDLDHADDIVIIDKISESEEDKIPDENYLDHSNDIVIINVWNSQTGDFLFELKDTCNILDMRFSSDGKKIYTISNNGSLKIWDSNTGILLRDFNNGIIDVFSPDNKVVFSPDNKKMGIVFSDSTFKLLDIETGKVLIEPQQNSGFSIVAFSPDGEKIAAAQEKTIKIWHIETRKLIADLKGHKLILNNLIFSKDGKKLGSSGGETMNRYLNGLFFEEAELKVWDCEAGKLTFDLQGHKKVVHSINFSSDGEKIYTASYDETINIWFLENIKPTTTVLQGLQDTITQVIFSPDRKKLCSASKDGKMKIWDTQTEKLVFDWVAHTKAINSVYYSSDGRKIYTVSEDGTVKVWDSETGKILNDLPVNNRRIESVMFSASGRNICIVEALSSSYYYIIKIWDIKTEKYIKTDTVESLIVSPDGKKIYSALPKLYSVVSPDGKETHYREIKVLDFETLQVIMKLRVPASSTPGVIFLISFDGEKLLILAPFDILKSSKNYWGILDIKTQKYDCSIKQFGVHYSYKAFSPDGKKIIFWGQASKSISSMSLYDVEMCKLLWERDLTSYYIKHKDQINSNNNGFFEISPDSKKVLFSWSPLFEILDLETGKKLIDLQGYTNSNFLTFSPDGKKVVSGENDGSIKILTIDIPSLVELYNNKIADLSPEEKEKYGIAP